MPEIKLIEQIFNVKIEPTGHRTYKYNGGPVTIQSMQQLIDISNKMFSWQDPTDPHCGNNDGVLYLVINMTDGANPHYDTFFCFDPSDNSFSIG